MPQNENVGKNIGKNEFTPFNSSKSLLHGYRMEGIINEYIKYPPVVLNLDVTGRCSMKCNHCHHARQLKNLPKMPDLSDRLANTLPYFLRNWKVDSEGIRGCCIVGSSGDALLYKGLAKLLKNIHYSSVDIGLVSNFYGFTQELIEAAAYFCLFIGASIDAGTKESFMKIKNPPKDAWEKVVGNMEKLNNFIDSRGLRKDTGWKILILKDSYKEIYESCKLAKSVGCKFVQIRPADLPEEERQQIEIPVVEEQIQRAISDLEEPGKFEIVGIREKFSPDLKKILPEYCYLTSLTSTVTSDGKVWACVDNRGTKGQMIADCGEHGWTALRENWGSVKHIDIVHNIINNNGCGPSCSIRCSNFGYDKFFLNYFINDNVDRNMI